ncbi:MAG TPA: tetratricopeptide repeat protein [Kofleriaceae bacterium]
MATEACVSADLIVAYVEGRLDATARSQVETHADDCASCREALSELAAGSIARRSNVSVAAIGEAVDVPAGTQVARYLVLYQVGRGGMATVYAAYDPELDRKIALKVLHRSGRSDHTRLRREARALAQLAHPNVVAVYDVGEHDGLLFIAMELIDGQSMREWIAPGRTFSELAPVFSAAARALAAAHDKGIVHRDVKPENLLLDKAGVVRVSDFGLAARGGEHDVVAGTPAYMAPEQFEGTAGPSADAYALCLTLFEAVMGHRPDGDKGTRASRWVDADGPTEAKVDLGAPKVNLDAAMTGVPPRIADIVRRGLARDPASRPTLAQIATALDAAPSHRNRRIAIGAALLAASIGVFAFARGGTAGPQCDVAGNAAVSSWADHRSAVQRSFATANPAAAASVFAVVDKSLTTYFGDWAAMSQDSCSRTRVTGDQSDSLLDLRTRCLDQRLATATALVDLLATAKTPSVVEGAVTAVAGLPSIAGCGDIAALTSVVPLPTEPDRLHEAEALQNTLARGAALQLVGQYDEATALIKPVLVDAVKLDYAPVLATAKHLQGDLYYRAGDYTAAATALREAVAAAARGRDDRTATKALTLLAGIVGYAQGKLDEGMQLANDADAWSARAGRVDEDEAELADIQGLLHDAKGEPLVAKPFYEKALALREKLYGADHLIVALSLNNLAGVPYTLGKYEEARALHERAKAIREKTLGPVSADLAVTLNAIAAIDEDEQKYDDAEKGFRRAIAIWEQVLGKEHPDVAAAHNNLGNLLRRKGDNAGAIIELERAVAIWTPQKNPNLTSALGNLAITYYQQKDYAKAIALYNQVVAATPDNTADMAHYLVNRGQVLEAMENHPDAHADYTKAVVIYEATIPATDRRLAWALTILGKHQLHEKQTVPAAQSLARAAKILEADKEARPDELAAARFALARAKWDTGEHAAAIALARSAREGTKDVAVIDEWLKGKS